MSENSTTTMEDLSSPRPHHRQLPVELNQQIYLCFNPATQRKFIWGLGWRFYAMFRQKLLVKVFLFNIIYNKKVANIHTLKIEREAV
jgi:hypothetical protein